MIANNETAGGTKRGRKAKITPSAAQDLKAQMEANQISHGDPTPENTIRAVDPEITITAGDVTTTTSKKLKKLADDVKAAGKKPKQTDMVTDGKLDVPEPTSPLYIAGKRLAEAVAKESDIKDEKAEAILEVLQAMKRAKRYNYKAMGYTFELQHFGAQDRVKVIKPK